MMWMFIIATTICTFLQCSDLSNTTYLKENKKWLGPIQRAYFSDLKKKNMLNSQGFRKTVLEKIVESQLQILAYAQENRANEIQAQQIFTADGYKKALLFVSSSQKYVSFDARCPHDTPHGYALINSDHDDPECCCSIL